MKSIQEPVHCEWIIQKSRFVGFLRPVFTMDAVTAFVEECRVLHPEATHVCHACILSTEQVVERASDDGEPQKTAGFPLLEILKKNQLTDCVVVAVRYFGGIKLGAGGLIRAYANTARLCIEKATFTVPVSFDECRVSIEYSQSGPLESVLRQAVEITRSEFGEKAEYFFHCPSAKTPIVAEEIKKRTSSDLQVEIVRQWIRYQ